MICAKDLACSKDCGDCQEPLVVKARRGSQKVSNGLIAELAPAVAQCREAIQSNLVSGMIAVPAAFNNGMMTVFSRDSVVSSYHGYVSTEEGYVSLSVSQFDDGREDIFVNSERAIYEP